INLRMVSPFNLANAEIGGPESSNTATDDHKVRPTTSASTLRRQYLENELRVAREKMVDIQDLESQNITTPSRILRLISTRRTSPRGSENLATQLEASKERNNILAARIAELEAHMHSAWALGLSDEPPPGYTTG
ncbi:hypothetical protein DFH09DRAFT_1135664, partial [Mycena vulgaris]